jgi:hypothetical protein
VSVKTGRTQFGTPNRGSSTAMSQRGRVCLSDDCPTVLSVYNHSHWCSVHEQPKPRPAGSRP